MHMKIKSLAACRRMQKRFHPLSWEWNANLDLIDTVKKDIAQFLVNGEVDPNKWKLTDEEYGILRDAGLIV